MAYAKYGAVPRILYETLYEDGPGGWEMHAKHQDAVISAVALSL